METNQPDSNPGYRLERYADGVPFDPTKRTCVIDGWGFSTSSLSRAWSSQSVIDEDDGMHTVSCYRSNGNLQVDEWERHPTLDGTKWADRESAKRAAYEAGVLAHFIPERGSK